MGHFQLDTVFHSRLSVRHGTDGQTYDDHQRLMPPPCGQRGHNKLNKVACNEPDTSCLRVGYTLLLTPAGPPVILGLKVYLRNIGSICSIVRAIFAWSCHPSECRLLQSDVPCRCAARARCYLAQVAAIWIHLPVVFIRKIALILRGSITLLLLSSSSAAAAAKWTEA